MLCKLAVHRDCYKSVGRSIFRLNDLMATPRKLTPPARLVRALVNGRKLIPPQRERHHP